MLIIVGVECFLIDSATLTSKQPEPVPVSNGWFQAEPPVPASRKRVLRPPEWIPWSLIASGSIVVLYAMTLPRRWGAKPGD